MYWELDGCRVESSAQALPVEGRFVLQRHWDAEGEHLDLRLEEGDCLMGWRVAGNSLAGKPWAREKGPHAKSWLEGTGEVQCVDGGGYAWEERGERGGVLQLMGKKERWRLRVRQVENLPGQVLQGLRGVMDRSGISSDGFPALLEDGITARQRAIARFCGLGRELDGATFDEAVWRKTLAPLSLSEIHRHLEGLEVRFDRKYPPQPVSQPEALDEAEAGVGQDRAMSIVRDRF